MADVTTICFVNLLDKIAAEREWKQNKIENIKPPEINASELNSSIPLTVEKSKIQDWLNNFEQFRDKWCTGARETFTYGSGTPYGVFLCRIQLELIAIEDLDFIYYEKILDLMNSKGIPDFEPTANDILKLTKTNKTETKPECIWGC